MAEGIMRTCVKCGNTKSIGQFGISNRRPNNPDGCRKRACIDCDVDHRVVWNQKQKDKNARGPSLTSGAKVCTGCGAEKDVSEFYRNSGQSSGLTPRCKVCIKAHQDANRERIRAANLKRYYDNRDENIKRMKEWREANPETYKACKKAHYEKNRDKILARKKEYRANPETRLKNAEYMKSWVGRNRDRMRQHDVRRYHTQRKFDPQHVISNRMRKRMISSLKESKAGRSWESLVGYTAQELEAHLRKTMPKGYTWDDFMAGRLHIDHKVPLSAHHFTSTDDIDFRKAWAKSNLQLLPASVNCSKGAKLDKPFQPSFAGI